MPCYGSPVGFAVTRTRTSTCHCVDTHNIISKMHALSNTSSYNNKRVCTHICTPLCIIPAPFPNKRAYTCIHTQLLGFVSPSPPTHAYIRTFTHMLLGHVSPSPVPPTFYPCNLHLHSTGSKTGEGGWDSGNCSLGRAWAQKRRCSAWSATGADYYFCFKI